LAEGANFGKYLLTGISGDIECIIAGEAKNKTVSNY